MFANACALGISVDGGAAEYARIPAEAVSRGNITPIGNDTSSEEADSDVLK